MIDNFSHSFVMVGGLVYVTVPGVNPPSARDAEALSDMPLPAVAARCFPTSMRILE
jgi:hypothetical protein